MHLVWFPTKKSESFMVSRTGASGPYRITSWVVQSFPAPLLEILYLERKPVALNLSQPGLLKVCSKDPAFRDSVRSSLLCLRNRVRPDFLHTHQPKQHFTTDWLKGQPSDLSCLLWHQTLKKFATLLIESFCFRKVIFHPKKKKS